MPVVKLIKLSLMGALMVGTQVAMAALPNINVVSVLIILTATIFGSGAFYSVAVFVALEGLIYGFGIWFVDYLYVWPLLTAFALLFRSNQNRLFWAIVTGTFGLCFGALCSIPYLFIGGPAMAFSYWLSGIPFDITHCISNFVLTFVLYSPLRKLLVRYR